jgi:hypothetical protein
MEFFFIAQKVNIWEQTDHPKSRVPVQNIKHWTESLQMARKQ